MVSRVKSSVINLLNKKKFLKKKRLHIVILNKALKRQKLYLYNNFLNKNSRFFRTIKFPLNRKKFSKLLVFRFILKRLVKNYRYRRINVKIKKKKKLPFILVKNNLIVRVLLAKNRKIKRIFKDIENRNKVISRPFKIKRKRFKRIKKKRHVCKLRRKYIFSIFHKKKYLRILSFFQNFIFSDLLIVKSKKQNARSFEILSPRKAIVALKELFKLFFTVLVRKNPKYMIKNGVFTQSMSEKLRNGLIRIYIPNSVLYKFMKKLFKNFKVSNIKLYKDILDVPVKSRLIRPELFLVLGDSKLDIYGKLEKLQYSLIYLINYKDDVNLRLTSGVYHMKQNFDMIKKAYLFFTLFLKLILYTVKLNENFFILRSEKRRKMNCLTNKIIKKA